LEDEGGVTGKKDSSDARCRGALHGANLSAEETVKGGKGWGGGQDVLRRRRVMGEVRNHEPHKLSKQHDPPRHNSEGVQVLLIENLLMNERSERDRQQNFPEA